MSTNTKTIYIASDHGGYKLKENLKDYLKDQNFDVEDLGPFAFNAADDYPEFSFHLARAVAGDEGSLGILLCRSGQGVCIVANKIPGIRAGLAWSKEVAAAGRRDDHINVLCLPSDYINKNEAEKIVHAFLTTEPGKDERYLRRLKEIKVIESEITNS